MAADGVFVRIDGVDDLKRAIADLPIQLRKRILLGALRKAARVPLLAARQAVPVLSGEDVAKAPFRTPGLLKRRLSVRTSRESRRAGNVGVFVNIRPAAGAKYSTSTSRVLGLKVQTRTLKKASERGAKSRLDPFYWRFVEFGTKKMRAQPFLKPASETLPQALTVFERELGPQIQRFNNRK